MVMLELVVIGACGPLVMIVRCAGDGAWLLSLGVLVAQVIGAWMVPEV